MTVTRTVASCLTAACLCAVTPSHARDPAETARQLTEEGRVALHSGDRFLALLKFAMAHELQPTDPDIPRAMADVLVELGAPQGAARFLPSSGLGIPARQAAEQVRWATQVNDPDPARHFDATDAAIARLQSLIVQAQALQPPDPGLVRRLQGDMVVALRDRCLLYTSPSPRDGLLSRMPSSA